MRLMMKQRQAVTAVTVQRYRQSSKKVKQQILDEFCETTGYCRGYARFVLVSSSFLTEAVGKLDGVFGTVRYQDVTAQNLLT